MSTWLLQHDNSYPRQHTEDDSLEVRLAKWINHRRGDYREGHLSIPRRRALEELPGWTWDAHEKHWEEMLEDYNPQGKVKMLGRWLQKFAERICGSARSSSRSCTIVM